MANGSNLDEEQTALPHAWFYKKPPPLRTGWGRGFLKLCEFLWLSGCLLEAVGWIHPSMEIFLAWLWIRKKPSGACPAARWSYRLKAADSHSRWAYRDLTPTDSQSPRVTQYRQSSLHSCYTEHYNTAKKGHFNTCFLVKNVADVHWRWVLHMNRLEAWQIKIRNPKGF